jgi:glucuronoarabinoxylan endo-1,4-beta-xylanase
MKSNFFKTVGRLGMQFPLLLAGVFLTPLAGLATDSIYINTGTINNSNIPNIDATNFVNSGTWGPSAANPILVVIPYNTSHTLNYTNTGSMFSSVGWEFDYGPLPLTGGRGWSASFANNSPSAVIQAIDGTVNNPPGTINVGTASYLWVSATNIVNKGLLEAGPNGQIVLTGGMVNLSRSQLLINGSLLASGFISGTNFALDQGLYAINWAQTNSPADLPPGIHIPLLNTVTLWDGSIVTAPSYGVQDNCSTNYAFGPSLFFQPTVSDSLDNMTIPTNEVRQAVFVKTASGGITAQIRFTPSSMVSNGFQTAAVKLSATLTNPFTLGLFTNTVYLVDTLGSETNRGLFVDTNVSSFYQCSGKLYQPANYIVSRSEPTVSQTGLPAFSAGTAGAGKPASSFYKDPTYVFTSVSNTYSAYDVFVDNLATDPNAALATNLPGVIQISADNLDLTRTWLGAQGGIFIQTSNLVSSSGAIVDCQNLSFYLGATNGFLNLTNMAKEVVSRLNGPIHMWSAVWTNLQPVMQGTNITTNAIGFSIFVVDASQLSTLVPVTVQNLVMHSTNNTISDSLTVAQTMLLDGQGLTLLGQLTLSDILQDWTAAQAPNLRYFTNNGFLFVPNNAHFGDDTASPYIEFVNNGTGQSDGGFVVAGSQTIASQDIQISNALNFTYGSFSATAGSIEINGAKNFTLGGPPTYYDSIYSGADINFNANTLQIRQSGLLAGGMLYFNVTNLLSDGGAPNSFVCSNGFNLSITPQTGDLLGSTLTAVASGNNAVVDSGWAGQDRGPNWTGFTNNVALGTLALVATNYLPQFTPLFVFSPATGSNAMYVTTLDLSRLTTIAANLANMIQINPGMKIYVSQVILGFIPPGGSTPLDYLQSQFPGQVIAMPIVVSQSGSVDWNTVYQRIDGFGASSAFSGRTWSTNTANIFFSTNDVGTNICLGLSLLRSEIQPGATGSVSEIGLMQLASARGARIWSTPWSPQASFKDNNNLVGGNFVSANNQAYASQLANYAVIMKNVYGVNIYAVSIQNEPDANVNYISCHWTSQQFHDFVTNLFNAFQASNVTAKIMMPESENWADPSGFATVTMADPNSAADVSIFANHNYVANNMVGDQTPPSPFSYPGKALWETEVATIGDAPDGGIANAMYWAGRIHAFLTVANVNAWHYWWLITGNGDNEGLMLQGDIPTKRMYVVGQYSRFVRPGYYRINAGAGGSSLLVSAYKDTNSQNFAIVAVNTNTSVNVNQTFTLNNFSGVSNVTPWITSASSSLAMQSAVPVSGSSFTYTIPAQSVVTFVGQASAPANITISGATYQTGGHFVLTWNSTPGATYSVLKTSILASPPASWPAIITGYPTGGAAGGSLSYTDTTATATPAFYRVKSP